MKSTNFIITRKATKTLKKSGVAGFSFLKKFGFYDIKLKYHKIILVLAAFIPQYTLGLSGSLHFRVGS